jgi:hypothetical protein
MAPNGAYCNLVGNTKTKCPPPWKATGISTLFEVSLLLVAALVTGLAKQLAVLLLGHTLATLLNN